MVQAKANRNIPLKERDSKNYVTRDSSYPLRISKYKSVTTTFARIKQLIIT